MQLGCNTAPSKPSLMANMAKDDLTVYQLRAMDYEYASRFAQLVSAAVSDIDAALPQARQVAQKSQLRTAIGRKKYRRGEAKLHTPVVGLGQLVRFP